MKIVVNLRHLEAHDVELEGELPVEDLDIETGDEMLQANHPLRYDFEVQKLEEGLLLHGNLGLKLDCQCVRCLKQFKYELNLKNWSSHVPLQGEDAAQVSNDLVDLTPYVREDILLEFPQHPLCQTECGGLPGVEARKARKARGTGQIEPGSSAWAELNKLKF